VLSDHSWHRVDLASKLRNEEAVHHGGGCQAEMHGSPGRHDQLIHAGDALVRINEQPLAVHRDDFDFQREVARVQALVGIQIMRADPRDTPQEKHD
jgi:hypothetical protein